MASTESSPTLFYQSHNPTGNTTILLIHGACGSSAEWEQVVPRLTDQDFHLLIPDLPAHGQSLAVRPFTVEYAAQLILDLITKHARNCAAHVVGLSLGAHIAACIAARAEPGQLLSVIAAGYNVFLPRPWAVPLITLPAYTLHHTVTLLSNPSTEMAIWKRGEASYALVEEVMRTLFNPRVLEDIHVRTLAIAATKSSLLPKDKVESSKRILEAVVGGKENGSRAVQHRGVRHPWHVEEPALFAEMVLAWVKKEDLDSRFEDID
ncbi:uncharacterized protein N7459_008953 [Penicillium hispanicum]|uniref:uncharacterized protein n=1 Tax=Penicillium hispanicum TaxID=1080232 RepID=UPI002540D4F4|nr:uncharacterized protein N7459_008953 [Penicillium hispanicum]KAJ5569523.1 hypothetical protein N7459_008953 [Penicillium hispanicum]